METKEYVLTLLILASYGFFKEIRPSEPYLTEYLIDPQYGIGLVKEDVYKYVYPIWPFSYFGLLIPVFLLTDFLRYKPVIIFEGLAYIGTWALLLWSNTLLSMQFMQFVYGIATSTEVAYYTYIYAKVPKEYYQKVSSYSRSAILFGRFMSGFLSQIFTSFELLDYRELNYVSFGSVCLALILSFLLPSVGSSIYFHKKEDPEQQHILADQQRNQNQKQNFVGVVKILWSDAVKAYSNSYIVKWSLWVIISTCVNYQVGNYIQGLWEEIRPSTGSKSGLDIWDVIDNSTTTIKPDSGNGEIFNGAVEAAATLSGAITVFIVGFLPVNWVKWGDLAIVIVATASGLLLFFMSTTEEIWVAYIGYLVYRMSYQILMTVATVEIVKDIERDSYGLIFGANLFFALGCQSILTAVVNSHYELNPKIQFTIYGAIFIVPVVVYIIWGLLNVARFRNRNQPRGMTQNTST